LSKRYGRPEGPSRSRATREKWRTLTGHDQPRGSLTSQPTVSVVVPALNEEDCIDWVIEQMPSWVSEVVLVDGLSTDLTEAVARTKRPDIVVVHQRQRGKGAALRAGFAAASGDIIAMMDADGSTNPRELSRFVDALTGGADFVKGSRHLKGGGSVDFTRLRKAGNRGFVLLANLLCWSRFTDLCYGYCAFWRSHLDALALTADGFEIETQLVLNAVHAGLKICEVPSFELARRAGTSNLSAFRDGRRVLRTMLRERPGRFSRAEVGSPIKLIELEVASPGSETWLPAGRDKRRDERRQLDPALYGYTGPERRRDERRNRSLHTSTVFVVAHRWTATHSSSPDERRAPPGLKLAHGRRLPVSPLGRSSGYERRRRASQRNTADSGSAGGPTRTLATVLALAGLDRGSTVGSDRPPNGRPWATLDLLRAGRIRFPRTRPRPGHPDSLRRFACLVRIIRTILSSCHRECGG